MTRVRDLSPVPPSQSPRISAATNGVLEVELTALDSAQTDGSTRSCFTDRAGNESPNLRVRPGDLVIVHLRNSQTAPAAPKAQAGQASTAQTPMHVHGMNPCTSATTMGLISTNLHFHGLTIAVTCHQDDIQPGDPPFEYRFRVPVDEPPGLYWYHPHIHGFSNPELWKDTAIFITFDEGGGYYDSGYVQPLDYFGDGTRIPLIAVSRFSILATSLTNTPTTFRS